ncbi:MAG: hypothetical protein ACK56W_04750 [Pirellula sp.]|jgi:hypothetical protein|nr:hypothetical protein [Pirellula sp.]
MSNLDSLAIHLLREGQFEEAVDLYRDELGLTIPQAELLVHRLAEEYELRCPNRLITWLWIALAGFTMFFLGSFLSQV